MRPHDRHIGPLRRCIPALLLTALLVAAASVDAAIHDGTADGEWRYWGGDEAGSGYSALDLVDARNVGRLAVAWRWKADNFGAEVAKRMPATPLYVKGRLYAIAGHRRAVVSMDPATGETLWMWRSSGTPHWRETAAAGLSAGIAFASAGGRDVVYAVTSGAYLVALDAISGLPVSDFGINGAVDLMPGVAPDEPGAVAHGTAAPPIVINGIVVVGSAAGDGPGRAGGVRGYDAASGRMAWRFNLVPAAGEPGDESWDGVGRRSRGRVRADGAPASDSERGLVYVVTSSPADDYVGTDRPGDNLFGTSILALDAASGRRRWHFQMVHHDLWDLGDASSPVLFDAKLGRRSVPLVAVASRHGWVFAFNRDTGEPVWPIEERKVHASDVSGEQAAATQPFVTRPPPFTRQQSTEADLLDFTPALHDEARAIAAAYRLGPLFTPPASTAGKDAPRGTLLPFAAQAPDAIVDPESARLYVASATAANAVGVTAPTRGDGGASGATATPVAGPRGLPLLSPPYGQITAVDPVRGELGWQIANADTPQTLTNHPALAGIDLPRTGTPSRANMLLTRTLLLYTEGPHGAALLHALDKASGRELAVLSLPAPGNARPMTYLHDGRQFIVVGVGGAGSAGELVALTVPDA